VRLSQSGQVEKQQYRRIEPHADERDDLIIVYLQNPA
jgi:hypothetical protein